MHKGLESTSCLALGHVWSSIRKIPLNLQCFGVLIAWNPGSCSSFKPKMPEKMHIDFKKGGKCHGRLLLSARFLTGFLFRNMGPHIWSPNEKLECLMEANGFPAGRPRSNETAEATHVWGGGRVLFGGGVNKIPPRQARETT